MEHKEVEITYEDMLNVAGFVRKKANKSEEEYEFKAGSCPYTYITLYIDEDRVNIFTTDICVTLDPKLIRALEYVRKAKGWK